MKEECTFCLRDAQREGKVMETKEVDKEGIGGVDVEE